MTRFATLRLFLFLVPLVFAPVVHAQKETDFDRGMKFYEAARYDEAATAFKHVVDREPNNAEAYYQLGNSYFLMLRNQEAVKAYQRAVALKPDYYLAYHNLGTAYHRLRDFKQAINSYERALKIKPDDPKAILGLGVAYLELKDTDAALEQHKRLAAIDVERADKLYAYITNQKMPLRVLNGKALRLPQPSYPPVARAARASGIVVVWVSIDEMGKVISASVVSGNALLRSGALEAAKLATFSPTMLDGRAVKVSGVITYTFVAR